MPFKSIRIIVALSVFAVFQAASAEGWYLDVGLGDMDAEESDIFLDISDTYSRLTVGYERSDDIALEGGFLDLGEEQIDVIPVTIGEQVINAITVSADGVFGAMKGTIRGDPADFYLRMGVFKWEAKACASGIGCLKEDDYDLFVGAGLGFDAGPGSVNLELHAVELDIVNVTMLGASYTIPLGGEYGRSGKPGR